MKIGQIILKGVNNFENFSYSFEDEWTKTVPDSLLLMGPNGSGKTTILKAIADLWDIFGAILEGPSQPSVKRLANYVFFNCPLAAIKIHGFLSELPEPVWIFMGNKEEVARIVEDETMNYKIGGVWSSSVDRGFTEWQLIFRGRNRSESFETMQSWIKDLRERFIKNRLGGRLDLPNMILLESETRNLPKIEEKFSVIPEEKDTFDWLAQYSASTRRKGNIFNYLFTLKAVDEESYNQIVFEANKFLIDKEITGFDPTSRELMIKTNTGKSHPAYLLSSGEKQVLVMLAFITRWLRPGGIVLVDEPDLHLHVSLSNALVSHLKRMVNNKNGQLILASHAPELWERFTRVERIELGSMDEVLR